MQFLHFSFFPVIQGIRPFPISSGKYQPFPPFFPPSFEQRPHVDGRPPEPPGSLPPCNTSANELVHSPETPWKDNPRTRRRVWPRPAVLSSTVDRGLKSTTEELVDSELPTECLTVESEALRDLVPLRPLCGPPTHKVAALGALAWPPAVQ